MHTASRGLQPLLGRLRLDLHADSVGSHLHDQQLDDPEDEDVAEVDGVVEPLIPFDLILDDDRHHVGHDLRLRLAHQGPHLEPHSAICHLADHAEVLIAKVSADDRVVIEVIIDGGLLAGGDLVGKSPRDDEDAEGLIFLHQLTSLGEACRPQHHVALGEAVEVVHQLPCIGRVVQIHDGNRQIPRQPLTHKGKEEDGEEQRNHDHPRIVDRVGGDQSPLALHHLQERRGCTHGTTLHFRLLLSMTTLIPGSRSSILSRSSAFTSKVRKSICPVGFFALRTE